MNAHVSVSDLKLLDTEPRVQDLTIAEALEFAQPRDIRKLIDRNRAELAHHGEICATVAQNYDAQGRGRPGNEYWLNEPQSLLICMFSRTDKAAGVRAEIIQVFMAWRRGQAASSALNLDALLEFPKGEGPLQEHALKLATLRECRMIHGPRSAARLWRRLGLPQVGESVVFDADEGRACLAHLLEFEVGDFALRRVIDAALSDDLTAVAALREREIRIADEGGQQGLVIANSGMHIGAIYRGTKWADGCWRNALRKLPGALASQRYQFGVTQRRGTFIPAALIDDMEIAATEPTTALTTRG